jgi:large subunit ribosomal protein L15
VLGNGEISVKVNVTAHAFSASAAEKIAAAGGSTKTL